MDHLHVGVDAGGSSKRPPLIRLPPVKSEFPLPEERKKYIEDAWKVLTMAGIDCIFEDVLPPDDHYKTTTTPLDVVQLALGSQRATNRPRVAFELGGQPRHDPFDVQFGRELAEEVRLRLFVELADVHRELRA